MEFDPHRPIYQQIKEELYRMIARGELYPGARVPAVRETAQRMQVNPNTVQRAYREMEGEGFVFTRRGQGTFVTEDEATVNLLRHDLAREGARSFVRQGNSLGMKREELQKLLQEVWEEEGE